MNSRKPNNSECIYNGHKLSCIETEIECNDKDVYISIGHEKDDTFYKNKDMERIAITFERNKPNLFYFNIDLEDVLRFAKQNCNGIYERINNESSTMQ